MLGGENFLIQGFQGETDVQYSKDNLLLWMIVACGLPTAGLVIDGVDHA